jgi:SAM-dependent methyltransferase
MNWENLLKEMEKNSYPPNQSFDPRDIYNLPYANKRMETISGIFPDLLYPHKFKSLLDVGCNKGLFSFAFSETFKKILGIDPMAKMINIAQKIRDNHRLSHIEFMNIPFEKFPIRDMFDVIHFGQCTHYLFRDAVRKKVEPLFFLQKAKKIAKKYILIDGAFDGDPSVEFDAKEDKWSKEIKEMATIEGYAKALRSQFRLIKYGWSGDGATRFLAVFQKI